MDSGEKNENLQVLSHAESGNHLLLKFDRAYRCVVVHRQKTEESTYGACGSQLTIVST